MKTKKQTPAATPEDEEQYNFALRPKTFKQYIGQEHLIEKLSIAVEAARKRKEPMEHLLLHGPPGLGKTTLAHVVANEFGARVHTTTGLMLLKGLDLVGILTNLEEGDVLFIDEIHRLPGMVEECLYPAMEDFKVDITVDQSLEAKTIPIRLKPFTLVGATTRIGAMSAPLRSRFGLTNRIEYYSSKALNTILHQNVVKLGLHADAAALKELSHRSRGTPRIANRLLRRARDYAAVRSNSKLSVENVKAMLELEGIDHRGLDAQDREFLRVLIEVYGGGPTGVKALAATMSEDVETLEDAVEPYLLREAFLIRTPRGRQATAAAYEHLKLLPGD